MIVIPTLLKKLQNVKDFVRPLSKNHRVRTPFDCKVVKGLELLQNLHDSTFNIFFITLRELALEYPSLSDILNLKVPW